MSKNNMANFRKTTTANENTFVYGQEFNSRKNRLS